MPDRPDVRPIHRAADRAMRDELQRWTYDVPEELRLALCRAVVKTLQQASMLNYDRPWELTRWSPVSGSPGSSWPPHRRLLGKKKK